MSKPSYVDFDKEGYKERLKKYSTKAEVGVLSYKYSKYLSKFWKFRNPEVATKSAKKIYSIYLDLRNKLRNYESKINSGKISKPAIRTFVKMDLCRKFLQMGYTRSMRYYYHKSGTKWGQDKDGSWFILPKDYDPLKKQSAIIFKRYLDKIKNDKLYQKAKDYFNKLDSKHKQVNI